MITETTVNR